MINEATVYEEIPNFYKIVHLNVFRRTPGVTFDNVPLGAFPRIDAVDRVIHQGEAVSPGPVGKVSRPWYMHTHQDDHLVVLAGVRSVEIYRREQGQVERFDVAPDFVRRDGRVVFEGPAMLIWPRGVFHRVRSGRAGSAAVNFAVHHRGIDMRTNFSIYALDTDTGEFSVLREGWLDQSQPPTTV